MIRIGILGTGIITECHFWALDKLDNIKIEAIASIDESEGKNICDKYGARYYKDYENLLTTEKELDGIIVALPNYMHYECCVKAIQAGIKNIFCEKPLCTSVEDSVKLVELVRQTGVMLQTGYMKRFNPAFAEIKKTIPELGELECVDFSIFMSAPEPDHSEKRNINQGEGSDTGGVWYSDVKRSGGGAMVHNGSHHLDLLRYFLGDVEELSCKVRYEGSECGEYFYNAVLTMKDGLDVNMRVGRVDVPKLGPDWSVFDGGWNESVEVIGTRGYIKAENPTWQGYQPIKVTRWQQGMSGPETHYYECNEQWLNEFSAFIKNCEKGEISEDCPSVIDGYKVDRIIETMRESGKTKGAKKTVHYEY